MLVTNIGDGLGIKQVPIEFTADGKRCSLKFSDVAEADIEAIEGQGGADVTIDGHPLCISIDGYENIPITIGQGGNDERQY